MLCGTAEAQTKQNTFISLWGKNKRHRALREETNSPSSVASTHKLRVISVFILDEQQKKFLPRKPDISHNSERGAQPTGSKSNRDKSVHCSQSPVHISF